MGKTLRLWVIVSSSFLVLLFVRPCQASTTFCDLAGQFANYTFDSSSPDTNHKQWDEVLKLTTDLFLAAPDDLKQAAWDYQKVVKERADLVATYGYVSLNDLPQEVVTKMARAQRDAYGKNPGAVIFSAAPKLCPGAKMPPLPPFEEEKEWAIETTSQTQTAVANSELNLVLDAAFQEYVAEGKYPSLYKKYMGAARNAPACAEKGEWISYEKITPGSTLDKVLKKGVLRIGCYINAPYYYVDEAGKKVGFDLELATALAAKIRKHYPKSKLTVQWIEKKMDLKGSGMDTYIAYDEFLKWLKAGEFDAVFAGIAYLPNRPVDTMCPSTELFSDAIYTGKEKWDLSKLQSGERKDLIDFMSRTPNIKIVSTAGGPSQESAEAAAKEANEAGGSVTTTTGTVNDLISAVTNKTVHFIIGDGVALSNLVMLTKGFTGLNLNIVMAEEKASIAAFTLAGP